MENRIFAMETAEHFVLCGKCGNHYEFNVFVFDGDIESAEKKMYGYPGVFILAQKVCTLKNNVTDFRHWYLGASDDIGKMLKNGSVQVVCSVAEVNCICYYYEPSEALRNDALRDISCANKFLYVGCEDSNVL